MAREHVLHEVVEVIASEGLNRNHMVSLIGGLALVGSGTCLRCHWRIVGIQNKFRLLESFGHTKQI